MLVVCRSRARVPEPFPYVPSAWGGQTFLHALRSAVLGVAVSPLGAKGLLGNSKPLKDREGYTASLPDPILSARPRPACTRTRAFQQFLVIALQRRADKCKLLLPA